MRCAGGGIEAVGGLIEDQQARAVDDGLGQLGELLHAQGIGSQKAVAGFAEADVEEHFVGALERGFGGKAGELAHHADEGDGGHVGDEGVVLGHVADERAGLAEVAADVVAEDGGGAGGDGAEAQEGLDERGFSGAVGAEQADDSAGEADAQILENLAIPKADA